jgi:LysM repeat protein
MKVSRATVVAAVAASLVSGCATMGGEGQQQAMGAGIGAALGCGVGVLITRNARGCAIGAAAGGLLGWGVVKINQYQAKQVRSASADRRVYGLTKAVDTSLVKIRKGASSPKAVKPGQVVVISTDYSLLLPRRESSETVYESWALKKDGKVLYSLPEQANKRTGGGWVAEATINVPKSAPPGTYVVEHKVKAGSSYDTDESTFIVKS